MKYNGGPHVISASVEPDLANARQCVATAPNVVGARTNLGTRVGDCGVRVRQSPAHAMWPRAKDRLAESYECAAIDGAPGAGGRVPEEARRTAVGSVRRPNLSAPKRQVSRPPRCGAMHG